MRKRIVVVISVGFAILIGGFVALQPKRGSVEYHKRKYREAFDTDLLAKIFGDSGVSALDRLQWKLQRKRIEFHRQALIDSGFFEQKRFVFSNRPPREAIRQVLSNSVSIFTNATDYLACPVVQEVTTNSITVVARSDVMSRFEGFVRESDGELP